MFGLGRRLCSVPAPMAVCEEEITGYQPDEDCSEDIFESLPTEEDTIDD